MSDHKPVIMKTTIIFKKHCKKRKIQQIDYRRLMNIANVQEATNQQNQIDLTISITKLLTASKNGIPSQTF